MTSTLAESGATTVAPVSAVAEGKKPASPVAAPFGSLVAEQKLAAPVAPAA
jgi:hypothetical protein